MEKSANIKTAASGGKNFFMKNINIFSAAFASAALVVLIYLFFEVAPFGDITVLKMDLYHQYAPFLAELYERVTNLDSLIYSWTSGLGNSFIGNYFNYLSSPFNLIIFLFGRNHILEAISFIVLIKCALSSASFAYFLKKSTGRDDLTLAAFGVLYSFSAFFIAYYWNIMWTDAVILLPLLALGIEKLIKEGKCRLYFASLFLAMVTNYYMAFMMCIFAVIFFLYFYFVNYNLEEKFIPIKKSAASKEGLLFRLKNSRFLVSGSKFAVVSVVAAGTAAFALIPTYFALKQCSATSGTFPDKFKTYFTIFDFIVNHFAGITPTLRSSGGNVLPNVYCGAVIAILIPLFLFAKSISGKEKIVSSVVIAFFFFSFNTNYLNYIWHGFHFPNDLPYRFSFMYSFFLLLFAYKSLTRIKEYSRNQILLAGCAAVAFVVIAQKTGSKNLTELAVIISIVTVAVWTVILSMFKNKRFAASSLAMLVFICAIAEVAAADTNNFSLDQAKSRYAGDLSEFQELKEKLDAHENGEFYRMELAHLRTRNDPSWYYYNGVSAFSSLAYEKLSNMQKNIGMFGNYINSYTYNPQTPLYNAMFSLKYVVDNDTDYNLSDEFYEKSVSCGKFTAYKNKYYLPIAFCVSKDIENWNSSYSDPFEVQNEFFNLATGIENLFTQVDIANASYVNIQDFDGLYSNYYSYSKIDKDTEGSVTFTYNCDENTHLYLYVKSSTIKKLNVISPTADMSQEISKPYILDIGAHNAGDFVNVTLQIPENSDNGSFDIYLYKMNSELFKNGFDSMQDGAIKINEFKDTHFSGSFTAKESQLLYTSVPYDSGWKITLDGEEVREEDIVKIGESLIGVRVSAGAHEIEFKFTPKGLYLGISVSVLFALIAALLYIFRKRTEKLLVPVRRFEDVDEETAKSEVEGVYFDSAQETDSGSLAEEINEKEETQE